MPVKRRVTARVVSTKKASACSKVKASSKSSLANAESSSSLPAADGNEKEKTKCVACDDV